jgi:asparagine synthase (glutamine-hydrolysing)
MRRLSIIDLAGGHQPLSNADETAVVGVQRRDLQLPRTAGRTAGQGLCFKTGSDCEVLLHLYDAEGDDFIHRLNGMFDFALWDARRRRLLIGRDRLGVKPLYVLQDGSAWLLPPRPRRCWPCPGCAPSSTAQVVADYLHLGYVPRRCIFKGIRKLPPATLLAVEDGQVREWRYWRLPGG